MKRSHFPQGAGTPGFRTARNPADNDTARLMRLVEHRRFAELEDAAHAILRRNGHHSLALKALSFALIGLRKFDAVLPVTERALGIAPNDGELHNNRAIALAELMRWDDAIPEFEAALALAPGDYEIQKNLGVAYSRLYRWNDAVPFLLKAIELHPDDYLEAIEVLARCLLAARRLDEAVVVCRMLHEAFPDYPDGVHRLAEVELLRCDWSGVDDYLAKLKRIIETTEWADSPWGFFKYWNLGMPEFRTLAERYAARIIPEHVRREPQALPIRWRPGERPLRVGYLSSDFADHPVSNVLVELFERHSDAVTLYAYSLRADDGSMQRKRIQAAVENFVDVERLSVPGTCDRIRADEIDILVDLNGWTGRGRAEALALRCAPIQVSWLGYAGTMGTRLFADYVIGDDVVTPPEDARWYVEEILRLPGCFMPVDTRHAVAERPTRESQSLPEDAFVLVSFNTRYKFNPRLFDLWCSLLREMPDAVLWLLVINQAAADNLRAEATKRGVASERLVFAERVPDRATYLARIPLADLALDTFPYGSHTTGVDALVAGVPMVTRLWDTYPGRVGASLLKAAGLPELIATSDDAYCDLVLNLYRDRPRLAELRRRLAEARNHAPLFDMAGFAAKLEELYFGVANRALMDASASTRLAPAAAP